LESNIKSIRATEALRSRPNKGWIKKAAKMISESKMPLILVGNDCIRKNASGSLRKFVQRTQME
jgi:thiamine pyrophosphate-dependent acetolactate synthase large subunit-like protein